MSLLEQHAQKGICLAIDTSTASMAIAVLKDGELLAEHTSRGERNHSVHLLPNVRKLLASLELRPKDLDAVAVGAGPGSYTGVRIGVSVAKTFAWSLRIPLLGVSSLEALALGAKRRMDERASGGGASASPDSGRRWFIPLMDARRGQAFTAVYEDCGDGLAAVAGDGIRLMEHWAAELAERAQAAEDGGPDLIVFAGETEGFAASIERLQELWPGRVEVSAHGMRGQDVGKLAVSRWARGETEDVYTFVPNYTQLAEAEVKLLAKSRENE